MRPDFTYRDLKESWKRHIFLVPIWVAGTVILAFLWLNLATPRYTAETVIGPTSRKGGAARGIRLEFQDLAQERIRNSPNETSDDETLSDFARAMQLLLSPEIAAILLQDQTLATESQLFSVGNPLKRFIWMLAGQRLNARPDAATLSDILKHELHIEHVGRSAMRKLWLRHPDRDFVVKFLDALERVTQSDQRRALADLLAAQEQTLLLLSVDLPFAADQIEKAQAPSTPDWPNIGLTLFMALALGLFLGFYTLYALAVQEWLKKYP